MLESVVASLLNRVLGSYVENFDPKQLNIGIWNGDVKLHNLNLKRAALDKFKLPIDIIHGSLGELVLQIPWSNLKNKPVKVVVKDVYLLVEPKLQQEYDAAYEEQRLQNIKMEKLANMELMDVQATEALSTEEEQKNQSFTESLVNKIVDNLQLTIQNIHIRYEDKSSVPNHPYSFGITLKELSAVSSDKNWNPAFISGFSDITFKLVTLSSLSAYWNTDSVSITNMSDGDKEKILEEFTKVINSDIEDLQYLLKPVSGVGRISIAKKRIAGQPKTKAQLLFDKLGFVVDSEQYRDALWTADLFRLYSRSWRFKKYRPKTSVDEDPKAWFKFAQKVVFEEIHQKHQQWTWEHIEQHIEDRKRYIALFKRTLHSGEPLTLEETNEFNELEKKLSYEDLRLYRRLAKTELKREDRINTAAKKKTDTAGAPAQTWGQWFWGSKPAASSTSESESNDNESGGSNPVEITEEQRQELYDAIEWDEEDKNDIASEDIPKDEVVMEIETALNEGSFTLLNHPHAEKSTEIASVMFAGVKALFHRRPDSFLAHLGLRELRVDDCEPGTLFPQIVTVKNVKTIAEHVDNCSDENSSSEPHTPGEQQDDFFSIFFESNPLDGSADSALTAKLKSMTVFYNARFIEQIAYFFKPPNTHLETLGAIMNAAGATVEGFRNETRLGLEYALQEHKTINLKLDIQAPLIVVPLDHKSVTSPCAIVDAGHISVISDPASRELLEDVKAKRTLQFSSEDWAKLESLMYDKFKLQLHDTQILLGADVRSTLNELSNRESNSPAYVLDRVNMDFTVEVSILPEAHHLTKFRISGNLPLFRASMSDAKYKIMMKLIDVAIPHFDFSSDGDSESEQAAFSPLELDIENRDRRHDDDYGDETSTLASSDDASTAVSSTKGLSSDTADSQKLFEFKFVVDRVELALFRCTDIETLEQSAMVDMNLEGFSLEFIMMPKQMTADVALSKLTVDDYLDSVSPPNLRKLVSCEGDSQDLFKVFYRRSQMEEDMSKYHQFVDLQMSALRFVAAPKSSIALLDFVITTFTNPDETTSSESGNATPDQKLISDGSLDDSKPEPENLVEGTITVKVDLKSIVVILNDDGIQLCTLSLDSASVGVYLLAEQMKVQAQLGSLSLLDDVNVGSSEDSMLRRLVSIEGDRLVDFEYESHNNPREGIPYNSSVYLRSESVRLNIVEEPLSKIVSFFGRLQQIKGLYDAARQAALDQANQIQNPERIKLDILVSTPIIVFPRPIHTGECNMITANLGEIFIHNTFDHNEAGHLTNNTTAGIRNVLLTSSFIFSDGTQNLQIIDNFDLTFDVSYVDSFEGIDRASTEVVCKTNNTHFRLTEIQLRSLLDISTLFSAIMQGDGSVGDVDAVEEELIQANRISSAFSKTHSETPPPVRHSNVDSLHFSMKVDEISLTLYSDTVGVLTLSEKNSLSKLSLNDVALDLRIKGNGDMHADTHIHSFTIHDIRDTENYFNQIMPPIVNEEHQFMATVKVTQRDINCLLTIDSPRMIVAVDYLHALVQFSTWNSEDDGHSDTHTQPPTNVDLDLMLDDDDDDDERSLDREFDAAAAASGKEESESRAFLFSINVVDAGLVVLADPKRKDTDALVLNISQFVANQGATFSMSLSRVGMFLSTMRSTTGFDDSSAKIQILDEFSITASMDSRGSDATHKLAEANISVEPLVLRLSGRDIVVLLTIAQRVTSLMAESSSNQLETSRQSSERAAKPLGAPTKTRRLSTARRSGFSSDAHTKRSRAISSVSNVSGKRSLFPDKTSTIVHGENLHADFDGIRVIIIEPAHEFPVLDFCVKPIAVTACDWSSDLTIDFSTEAFANIYNFEKSAWEPLVESWDVGCHTSRNDGCTHVNVFSRKITEFTLTIQSIYQLNEIISLFNADVNDKSNLQILEKPRGQDSPYRILNQTGYTIEVSADEDDEDELSEVSTIADGEEIPWRFYDWRVLRENLSTDKQKVSLRVKLLDSGFDELRKISVTSIGEHLHIMSPKNTRIAHRLVCQVDLLATVKKVTMRSAFLFTNSTKVRMDLSVDNGKKIWNIEPGSSRAVPIQYIYSSMQIMPDPSFGFTWSRGEISYKSFVTTPHQSIACDLAHEAERSHSNLRPGDKFFIEARFDSDVPLSKIYPYINVVLTAPLEVVNLLPYDLTYSIYDRTKKRDWEAPLKQGASSPCHVVELADLILLSVTVKIGDDSQLTYTSTPKKIDVEADALDQSQNILETRCKAGHKLNLRYHILQDEGHGRKIQVYSPYLILNQTGLNCQIKRGVNSTTSQVYMGKSLPQMWSYETNDRSNRAMIAVGNSKWSSAQSFDAIGSSYEVVMPSNTGYSEIHVGVHTETGSGIYNMTKIITITPRFILNNKLPYSIRTKDAHAGSNEEALLLKPGDLIPLQFMKKAEDKQVCIAGGGEGEAVKWSAPFDIASVGRTYVKLYREGKKSQLLMIDVLLEHATIYIHIREAKAWPFSIKNHSSHEFIFYQSNPFVDEEGVEKHPHPPFTKIQYRLPPKSEMPYSWDFPAAKFKELVLSCEGRERRVQLQEIGILKPMRLDSGRRITPEAENGEDAADDASIQGSEPSAVDLRVVANGPVQDLELRDYDPDFSIYQLKRTNTSTSLNSGVDFKIDEVKDDPPQLMVNIRFEGVGISVINKRMMELIYVTTRGFQFDYRSSTLFDMVSMKMKWLQIDNQLYGGVFPVILFPSVVPKNENEMNNHPTFSASVTRLKDDSYGVFYIKHATLLLQQITFEIDEDFLVSVLDFIKDVQARTGSVEDRLCSNSLEVPEPANYSAGDDVYFEVLHIQPAQMDLSFMRSDHINADETMATSSNAIAWFLNVLTMAIGNINDAPVKLNALVIENARETIPILAQRIQTHYTQEFVSQIHKILGSADVLGNPVGLFNNISSGFMDIFYEPYNGYILNDRPEDIYIGIAKGGLSFVKKSVFGVADSFAKVTGSISKGLAAATLDQNFQSRRRANMGRNKPAHALYGFTNGATSFVDGLTSGVSGLALSPMKGAQKEGAAGFFKGIGKGIVGLPTKTAIGFFDFANNLSEGVRNTTTVFDGDAIDKVRPTRYIAHDGIVRPYSEREAIGQSWLKTLNSGRYFADEYVAHVTINHGEMAVIVTYKRILLIAIGKALVEWEVKFTELQQIVMEATGIALILRGGVHGPFIPLSESSSRKFLYSEIAIAVKEFNHKHQTLG